MKTTANNQTGQPKTKSKAPWVLLGLGLAGLLSFFGLEYFKHNKKVSEVPNDALKKDAVPNAPKAASKPKAKHAGTAAKKTVKQNPLKTAPDTAGKPKDTAANKSQPNAGPGTKQNNKTLNVASATLLAKSIYTAIARYNFPLAFALLKNIKNTSDYSAVSTVFKALYLYQPSKTLVEGLLNAFNSQEQTQALTNAFLAMGLKYDGKKWALSGLDDEQFLITVKETKVWKNPKEFVSVPVNMLLGKEVAKRGNFSLFENERNYFLVESQATQYYKSQNPIS